MRNIIDEYYAWIYQKVCGQYQYNNVQYNKLLSTLFSISFQAKMLMDENRSMDGIDLRYRFGYENGYSSNQIASDLDIFPCNILEMMYALALRCEEDIMGNSKYGDRVSQWFWEMIVSLGLGSMTDDVYDPKYVEYVICKFLNRDYFSNGEGGLFTIHDDRIDMTKLEIWYQLQQRLMEIEE